MLSSSGRLGLKLYEAVRGTLRQISGRVNLRRAHDFRVALLPEATERNYIQPCSYALKFLTPLANIGQMPVTLRPVVPDDQDFLYEVYASTRRAEMAAWGWNAAQQDAFLRMQFTAQRRSYEMQHTHAAHSIILLDGEPVGRLLVARSEDEIKLTDISLLPEQRGQGIGSGLIRNLLDEAEQGGRTVCLEVLRDNPAARLYARLGFVVTGEHDLYLQMRRHPTTA